MFKNHPKGLLTAALSNMGERFGYYIMNAVLVLFLCSKFGLNKPLPNAIRNKATQVRVNNQVVFCDVARIGTDRIMYPIAITTRPVLMVPL